MRKSILLIVQVALIISLSSDSYSQWKQKSGSFGGYIYSVIEKDGKIFAASDLDGIHVTNDNGLTWEQSDKGIPYSQIYDLLEYDNNIYAAAFGGIFRSSDDGCSWTQTDTGIADKYFFSLASNDHYLFAVNSEGIYRSSDGGSSWLDISSALNLDGEAVINIPPVDYLSGECSKEIKNINTSPFTIAANGSNLYCILGLEIYYSDNNGDLWEKIKIDKPLNISCINICDSLLLAGGYDGLFSLTKKDTVWESRSLGLTDHKIIHIKQRDSVILAGSYFDLFISTDKGETWNDFNCGLSSDMLNAISISGDKFFAGTGAGSIYMHTNNNTCWFPINISLSGVRIASIKSNETALFIGTDQGLYASTNYGDDWQDITTGLPGSNIVALGVHGNYLFAAARNHFDYPEHSFYRSSDNGQTWIPADSGMDIHTSIYAFLSADSCIFAGGNGIYRSCDNGGSWEKITSELIFSFTQSLACGVNNKGEQVLYAGTIEWSFISNNNGNDWVRMDTSFHLVNICAFASNGTNVFAGSRFYDDIDAVYLSTDFGLNWQPYSSGLFGLSVSDFAVTDSSLFASTLGSDCGLSGGVFLSRFNGNGWTDVNTGLDNADVSNIHIYGDYIFAGTGEGIWRRPLTEMTTGVTEEMNIIPAEFLLEQNYPNPFNPVTNIEFHVPPGADNVTLKIFDVLGNEITTLVNEVRNAGTFKVSFNASELSSGVYFYTLQSGAFKQTKKLVLLK